MPSCLVAKLRFELKITDVIRLFHHVFVMSKKVKQTKEQWIEGVVLFISGVPSTFRVSGIIAELWTGQVLV